LDPIWGEKKSLGKGKRAPPIWEMGGRKLAKRGRKKLKKDPKVSPGEYGENTPGAGGDNPRV